MALSLRDLHQAATAAGLAWLALMGVVYGVVFLADRRRTLHAWLAVAALAAAVVPWTYLGMSRLAFDYGDGQLLGFFVPIACAASLLFTRAQLGLKRPAAPWLGLLAAVWLCCQLVSAAGLASPYVERAVAIAVGITISYQIAVLATVVLRVRAGTTAAVMLCGWSLLALASAVDLGAGRLYALPVALTVLALAHTMALAREHLDRIHQTERLRAELAQRLDTIEASYREIDVLNAELRRQIGLRSRQLAEVIARVDIQQAHPGALRAGQLIDGRYRVVGPLGSGAMGAVYEAVRLSDARRVALKVLARHGNRGDMARLAREAEILSRLNHPNLVAILDADVCDTGLLFIVMELIDGQSLDQRTARASTQWAVAVLGQIAQGLAAVHLRGIVHRDLKPANILIGGGDSLQVKIADFGVSCLPTRQGYLDTTPVRALPAISGEATARLDPSERIAVGPLTDANVIMGTPNYMAPELVHGCAHSRPATDIFSLGVIAFELLTGKRPFKEPPFAQALRGETPTPTTDLAEHCPELPAGVAMLLQRCLAADPNERPSARLLAETLLPRAASGGGERRLERAATS